MSPGIVPGSELPLVSVFPYRSQARQVLWSLKFHGKRSAAHSIGYTMADAFIASPFADKPGWLLCCVPMTAHKRKDQGFNHSELLARAAARWLGLECAPGLLVKIRDTPAQHGLFRQERLTNLLGAYAAAEPGRIAGRSILLCDDVCTTGGTLCETARVLYEAGAAQVICLTYLRTDLEEEDFDDAV